MLTLSHDSDTKAAMAGTAILWENGDKIIVNGEEYPISVNQNEAVVTVRKAESYSAFFPAQIYTRFGKRRQSASPATGLTSPLISTDS